MSVTYLNKICPVCGGYISLLDNGVEICNHCHYIMPTSNVACINHVCRNCGTELELLGTWWSCPRCGYGYKTIEENTSKLSEDLIKEIAKQIMSTPLYKYSDDSSMKIDPVKPTVLEIVNCKKFSIHLKELDVEFELEPDKLENIDTLIINGYKYVKEN